MKRKMAYVGFSFLGGLFVASLEWGKYNLQFILFGILLTVVLFLLCGKYRTYIAVCAISYFLGISFLSCYTNFTYNKIVSFSDKNINFKGEVTDYTYSGSDLGRLTVKGKINGSVKTEISFFVPDDDYEYYDEVDINSEVLKISDNINFPAEEYYRAKGVFLTGVGVAEVKITDKNTKPLLKAVKNYRDYLFNRINSIVGGSEGGFLGAMLCGDKSEMNNITKTQLYRSGIGHIFSVSGTHMIIIYVFFSAVLGGFIKNRKIRFAFMELVVWSFALFSGFSPSVIRAAVMITMLLLSDVLFRFGDCMNTLGWCALIMPLFNPYIVRNPSFLLSLSGAVAVGAVAPKVINVVQYKRRAGKLVKSILVTLTVMFAAMPVSTLFFDEISLVSPLSNLLLVPICTAALSLTVIVAVTGGVGFIAVPVLKIAGALIHWVIFIADKFAGLSYSYVTISSMGLKMLISVLCLIVIVWAIFAHKLKYYLISAVVAYSVIISAFNISAIMSSNSVHFVFIPNGSGCQTVVYVNNKCLILDLGAKGKNNRAVQNVLSKRGIKTADSVLIMKECYYTAQTYTDTIYPAPKVYYGDFDSETEKYKTNDTVFFEDLVFSESYRRYKTEVDGIEVEITDSGYYIDGVKRSLQNEHYPVELEIENNDFVIRRLDYGFDEQYRLR